MVNLSARFSLFLALFALLAGCASDPEPGPAKGGSAGGETTVDWVRQWNLRLREQERMARERVKILPRYLKLFQSTDPASWEEGARRLAILEKRDEGFVYDRILEILPAAREPGKAGRAARTELVRMGEIIVLTDRFSSRDRAAWLSAVRALKGYGRQGVSAAAVKLVLKLKSETMADIAAAREGLLLLGPDAVRFLVEAIRSRWVRQVVKERCVDVLRSFGSRAVKALVGLLAAPEKNVRYMGARALGAVGDKAAAKPLLDALGREEDVLVACAMLEALGKLGDAATRPAVQKYLESEDISLVRFAARAALSLGDRKALPALARALARVQGEVDFLARSDILKALRKLSGKNFGNDPARWLAWAEKHR